MAGIAAVMTSLAPVARAAPLNADGAVDFVSGPGRAAFRLDGQERWVIDTHRYAGSPVLRVERAAGEIRLSLTGARFPGTDLPADLACRVATGVPGWTMDLRLALGGLAATVVLAKWLAGEEEARARVQLDDRVLATRSAGLALSGTADLTFAPDWTLRLAGPGIARLVGVGADDLLSDTVTLFMPAAGAPSMLQAPPARRTLVVLERKGRTWALAPALAVPKGWKLTADGEVFDVLQIETGENGRGELKAALAAETLSRRPALFVELGGSGAGADPLRLPLAAPRYAATLAPDGSQQALFAGFNRDPSWLHTGGLSVLVGSGPGAEPLELVNRNGRVTRAALAPALLAVSAPMAGVVAEPVWSAEGTRLSFVPAASNPAPDLPKEQPVIGPAPGDVSPILDTQPPAQVPPASEVPPVIRVPVENPDVGQIQLPINLPPIVLLPNLKVSVVRPQDLLVLTFEFMNLNLQAGGNGAPRLVRTAANSPAYIIVHFPPQHIAEQAFFETQTPGSPGDEAPPAPPVRSRIAGPSRLVFALPAGVTEVPYSLEALLSWTGYQQSVGPTALPPPIFPELVLRGEEIARVTPEEADSCNCAPVTPGLFWPPPTVQVPQAPHTAIEAPYRVIISPNKYAGWAHALAPVEHDGRTELWHTRLGVRAKDGDHFVVDELAEYLRTVRAIWSPDYDANALPPADTFIPFEMSLAVRHRHEIVRLSSDFTIPNFTPMPVKAHRLMLSALGAWLNVHGTWDPPAPVGLEEWLHRAAMGRDTYVKTVERGYLFPLGNRAALFTVTERKFQPGPDGTTGAYLRRRQYVVVREPDKFYPGPGQQFAGRQMPFKHIRLTTLVTPNLNPAGGGIGGMASDAYWLRVGTQDFQFHVVADDVDGRKIEFTTPLAFIGVAVANDAVKMGKVAQDLTTGDVARRERPFHGQKVAYAPSDKPGDTHFETASFTFGAEVPPQSFSLADGLPRFYPNMAKAKLRVAAIEAMSGSPAPAEISFHDAFLNQGFDPGANKGAVWAKMLAAVPLRFPADKSGAVATPNMDVGGLSRMLGPVGGSPDDMVSGAAVKAKQFLSDEAKILGGILLSSIIDDFGLDSIGGDGKTAPVLTNRVVYPKGGDGKEDKNAPPIGLENKLAWSPKLKGDPLGLFEPLAGAKLDLLAMLLTKFDSPGSPTYEVSGELTKFKIHLIGTAAPFMIVSFSQLTFKAASGQKFQVKPDISEVAFDGPLKFVDALKDFLKSLGGGFAIDLTPTGLKVGLSLPIPSIAIGVLAIQNIKLATLLTIPFNGDALRLRFAFCEREDPFCLTVAMFGGGGFFAVELGLDKYVLLEASLEFGGQLALDIGVASGGVHVFAGIYFKMENDDCTLTGYLRLGGSLSVLGLITISAEFYMGLTYESATNKVWGQATLTVKIEILFFSMSVGLSVERRFAGSGADPTFSQIMDENHWDEYCDAFAG
jgi:hypothetical protein